MTEPRTEAGRRLDALIHEDGWDATADILAIETEARASYIANMQRLAEANEAYGREIDRLQSARADADKVCQERLVAYRSRRENLARRSYDRGAAEAHAPTDGLSALISTILRKYGGTMKGRGDHDIFDALVRYRAELEKAR